MLVHFYIVTLQESKYIILVGKHAGTLLHCYNVTLVYYTSREHAGTLLHCYNVTLVYYTSREACWYIVTLLQCYTSILY